MYNLNASVCIVTGAYGYIGSHICNELARQGATVIAFYNESSRPELLEFPGGIEDRIHPIQIDLRQLDSITIAIAEIVKRFGRIDVLVCAAGITFRKSALLTTPEECDRVLQLNFNSVVQICKTVLRPMFRQSDGRIILIGSGAGARGLAGQSVYAASKAALQAYAQSLAQEVGDRNITVNVVAPGALMSSGGSIYSPEEEDAVKSLIGLKRLGSAAEIAAVVSFLASKASSYISGAIIPVDGAARF